jgi:ferredoxin
MVTLFFSGWHGPWSLGPIWFLLKLVALLFVFIWSARRCRACATTSWTSLEDPAGGDAHRGDHCRLRGGVLNAQPVDIMGFGVTFKQTGSRSAAVPEFGGTSIRALWPAPPLDARTGSRSGSAARSARWPVPGGLHSRRPAENTLDNRVSAGERYARIYEINMSRCIFCGYCELACPFDAITLGNEFEIFEYNRDDQIYTKEMLAEPAKASRSRTATYDTLTPTTSPTDRGVPVEARSSGQLAAAGSHCVRRRRGLLSNPFSALALIGNPPLSSCTCPVGEFVAAACTRLRRQ